MTLREIVPEWLCKFSFNKITVCRDLTVEEVILYIKSHFRPHNISGRIIEFEHPLPTSNVSYGWDGGMENWYNLMSLMKTLNNFYVVTWKKDWSPMTPLEHIEKYDLVRLNWMDFTLGESGFTILLLVLVWLLLRIVYRKVFKKI